MSLNGDASSISPAEDQRVQAESLSDASCYASVNGSSEGYAQVSGVTEVQPPENLHQHFSKDNENGTRKRKLKQCNDQRIHYSPTNIFENSVTSTSQTSELVSQTFWNAATGLTERNARHFDQATERYLPSAAAELNPVRPREENIYNTLDDVNVRQFYFYAGKRRSKKRNVWKKMFVAVLVMCNIALICAVVIVTLNLCSAKDCYSFTNNQSNTASSPLCINCSLYENLKLSYRTEELNVTTANEMCCLDSVYIFQRLLKGGECFKHKLK